MKLIPHTEYIGGVLADPYLDEREYEVGISDKDRVGEKYIAYNKIPFKSYEYHNIDTKKKLPENRDTITLNDVIISFLELRKAQSLFIPIGTYPHKYIGNHITDYFNEHIRNDTMNSAGRSLNSVWNDIEQRKKLYESTYALKRQNLYLRGVYNHKTAKKDIFKELTPQDFKGALQNSVFSNNQFKAYTAKVIYDYFDKKGGINNILDFSSGWGGRMVGALSLDKNYIGIDPNIDLRKSYNDILETLKPFNKSKVEMNFNYGEEVDYSKLDYDFVFTSPPYIAEDGKQTEKYKNMKSYDIDSFYTDFLLPTIYRIIYYLPQTKYFCINTNKSNMEVIKKLLLGDEDESIPYKTKERAGGKSKRQVGGKETERYGEYIYCYKKSHKLMNIINKNIKQNKLVITLIAKKSKPLAQLISVGGSMLSPSANDAELKRLILDRRHNV